MKGKLKTFYQLKEENKVIHDFMIRSAEHTFNDQVAVMRDAYFYHKEIYSDSDVCNNIKSKLSMGSNGKEYVSNQLEYAKSQYKSELQPTKDWVKWAFETATNKNFDDYKADYNAADMNVYFQKTQHEYAPYLSGTAALDTFCAKAKLIGYNEMIFDGIFEDKDVCVDGYAYHKTVDADSYVDSFLENCAALNTNALAAEINASFESTFDFKDCLDVYNANHEIVACIPASQLDCYPMC